MSEKNNVTNTIALIEYQNFLLSGAKRFGDGKLKSKEQADAFITQIFKYVFCDILKWDGETALKYTNEAIINAFRLKEVFNISRGYACADNYFSLKQLLSMVFPNEISYSMEDEVIDEYEKIISPNNKKKVIRYKNNFFIGTEGLKRLQFLLKYIISQSGDLCQLSQYDLLKQFMDLRWANEWLKIHKLHTPVYMAYDSPAECIYCSINGTESLATAYYINLQLKANNMV